MSLNFKYRVTVALISTRDYIDRRGDSTLNQNSGKLGQLPPRVILGSLRQ